MHFYQQLAQFSHTHEFNIKMEPNAPYSRDVSVSVVNFGSFFVALVILYPIFDRSEKIAKQTGTLTLRKTIRKQKNSSCSAKNSFYTGIDKCNTESRVSD